MKCKEMDETQYLERLERERHLFAWTLHRYGPYSLHGAARKALRVYPYEPPEEHCREMIFDDEAWHWAMLRIHGHLYWVHEPDFEHPSQAYEDEKKRFEMNQVGLGIGRPPRFENEQS